MGYKYSIIVTFYNAELYVLRTLNNLKKIVNSEIEIVIVNDGSTDRTLSLIKEFNLSNSIIVNQENLGVSAARNAGLKKATGDYVLFLDGDDWLDYNLFNVLNKYYRYQYDLLKFGLVFTNGKTNTNYIIIEKDRLIKNNEIPKFINTSLCTPKFNSASNQIIRRTVLIDNNILFAEGIKFAEDFDFNIRLFNKIQNVYLLKDCYYYYYRNDNSTTKSYNKQNVLKCLEDAIYIYSKSIFNYQKVDNDNFTYIDVLDRAFKEITGCLKKVYLIDKISVHDTKLILKEFYNNNHYLKFYEELLNNNYKATNFLDKIIFNKYILFFNFIILFLYKVKKLVI